MRYFGTDGIRGIYGDELLSLAYRAGLAASCILSECYLGRDTRHSGEELASALTSGLIAGGCSVIDVGIAPTPAISHLSRRHGTGGIVVTASHNPPEFNGLKFFYRGCKLTSTCENLIEERMQSLPAHIGGGRRITSDGCSEYAEFLIGNGEGISGREVALDCAHGATYKVAKEVFSACGAKVTMLNADGDGTKINCGVGALFPHHVLGKAPLGFAFDGDGDRLAVTDQAVLDGDSALYNLTLIVRPKGVVGTVMNNAALGEALAAIDVPFLRTAVGDKHIGEAMRKCGYELGGEQSGHYIISPATSGDALLAALTLSRAEKLRRLDLVPQLSASVPSSGKIMSDDRFQREIMRCKREVNRLIVRMSGTEPKLRLMAEGDDEEKLKKVIGELSELAKSINKEWQKQ